MNPWDAILVLAGLGAWLLFLIALTVIVEVIGTNRVARWLRLPDDFE